MSPRPPTVAPGSFWMGVLSVSHVKEEFATEVEDPLEVEVLVEAADEVDVKDCAEEVEADETELEPCEVMYCEVVARR